MWKKIPVIVLMGIIIVNCTNAPDFSGRVVHQGNLISPKKLQRLKIGMTKEEATVVMGDSLLNSPFTQDRWDYVDAKRKGGGDIHIKYVSLYFKQNRLIKIERLLKK